MQLARTAEEVHLVSPESAKLLVLEKSILAESPGVKLVLSSYADRLVDIWPGRVKGVHRLHLSDTVTLTLIHDDILSGLSGLDAGIDAWFLDGFSPARNPDMWSESVMTQIARFRG